MYAFKLPSCSACWRLYVRHVWGPPRRGQLPPLLHSGGTLLPPLNFGQDMMFDPVSTRGAGNYCLTLFYMLLGTYQAFGCAAAQVY